MAEPGRAEHEFVKALSWDVGGPARCFYLGCDLPPEAHPQRPEPAPEPECDCGCHQYPYKAKRPECGCCPVGAVGGWPSRPSSARAEPAEPTFVPAAQGKCAHGFRSCEVCEFPAEPAEREPATLTDAAVRVEAERLAIAIGGPCDHPRRSCASVDCHMPRDRERAVAALRSEYERGLADGAREEHDRARHQGQQEICDMLEAALAESKQTHEPISEVLRQRFNEARARGEREGGERGEQG